MPAPATIAEFLDLTRKSGVVDEKRLEAHVQKLTASKTMPGDPAKLAGVLVRDGILTHFQAEQIMLGKWRRFTIGKYKVLERLGSGGMGSVYLCEHKLMRRRVAVKVLPTAKAADPSSLERFYREARAVAALDHPNIVHAYDIDQDESLHFLVMEYVDGASLQEIVKRSGPLDPIRAAHYIQQTALGLEHAHAAGLVHRDIKPGNVLVDRTGIVKILDMGLARFFNDEEDILTKKYDENVLGTADYLAPEQALDSHGVDIRADIYSLGGTFYFMLTGRTPFGDGTIAQKLIWHQTRQPRPITGLRPDTPAGMAAVIEKMMAKDPAQRYQTPREMAAALAPWTQNAIGPPTEVEMPRLSLAATGVNPGEASLATSQPSSGPRKAWQVSAPTARPAAAPAPTMPVIAPDTRSGRTADAPTAGDPQPVRPTTPKAAPARPVPMARAVTAAPPELDDEDSIPWEKVAAEAGRVRAEAAADAADAATLKRRSVAQSAMLHGSAYDQREKRLLRWIVVIVALVLITSLVVGCIVFGVFQRLFTPTPPPPVKEPLRVKRGGGEGYYGSVRSALERAEVGDRILLMDTDHRERLRYDGKLLPANITIEPAGGVVTWTSDGGADDRILDLSNLRGLRFRNIRFDGEDKVNKLIFLSGKCPGLKFEDVTLEKFRISGLVVWNCAGEEGQPVQLLRLTVKATGTPEAALVFGALKNMVPADNEYFLLQDCHLEGNYKKGRINFVKPRSDTVKLVNTPE